jgi:polysaccharide pyruvyl transferase WcaK-like protein
MKKILIINQYSANKGDRGVLFAMTSELLKHDVQITVSTHNPSLWDDYDFYRENNIKFVPWGWDFSLLDDSNIFERIYFNLLDKFKKYTYTINRKLFLKNINYKILYKMLMNPIYYKSLKESDIVISTGGHHITTLLSIDAISSQIYDISLALSLKKKTIVWSQSIGPLDFKNKENELFVNKILDDANSIYVRDNKSYSHIKNKNTFDTYESVFLLSNLFKDYKLPSKRDNVVGISIYSTKQRTDNEKELYIQILADFSNFVIDKYNLKVRFLPMEIKNSEPDDRPMIYSIIEKIKQKDFCTILDKDLETAEHLLEVSKCRFFVGHKTHSIIFSLTTGTPLIALAYHPKSRDFMKQFNFEDYVIDDKDLQSKLLINIFDKLFLNFDSVGSHSILRSKEMSNKISNDLLNVIS